MTAEIYYITGIFSPKKKQKKKYDIENFQIFFNFHRYHGCIGTTTKDDLGGI